LLLPRVSEQHRRQRELVASGASQTMKSKHIEGHAVDLIAYIGNRVSWELNLYDDIADADEISGN
jgi:peptidoglycan LD-endopeptidase CwlK